MLLLAATGMLMPAIYELVEGKGLPLPGAERVDFGSTVEHLSLAVALVLIATYVIGLVSRIAADDRVRVDARSLSHGRIGRSFLAATLAPNAAGRLKRIVVADIPPEV